MSDAQQTVSAAAIRVDLLLADVDGTLVTQEKLLTPAAVKAAEALRRAGVALAITSGRPPRGMSMLVEPLGLTTPIAGFNGGAFVEPDLTIIEGHDLDRDTAREALQLIRGRGLDAWLYTADAWFILDKDAPHVAREAWTVKFEPNVVKDFADADLGRAVKIVGISDDGAKVEDCERAAQSTLNGRASAARSQPYYLDITHPLANKGEVVAWLSRRLKIPRERIATIGDMPNDVLMFAASGYSIAMAQASEAVRAKATTTTDSNEADGFANAVRHLLARQEQATGEGR